METLKALALGTVPLVGLLAALLLGQASTLIVKLGRDEAVIAAQAETALDTVNRACAPAETCGTLAEVNRNLDALHGVLQDSDRAAKMVTRGCVPGPCGTLADVAKTLNTVRGTFGQVELAARHENQQLATLDAQERALFASTHAVLDSTASTLGHFDALIQSPAVTGTLEHVDAGTLALSDAVTQADGILKDGRVVADRYTYPAKKKWYATVWDVTKTSAELVWTFVR